MAAPDDPPRHNAFELPEAPVFRPTPEEFADPLAYIASIRPLAEQSGLCRIIPPAAWRPPAALEGRRFHFRTKIQPLALLSPPGRLAWDTELRVRRWRFNAGRPLRRGPIPPLRYASAAGPVSLRTDLYALRAAVRRLGGHAALCAAGGWGDVATAVAEDAPCPLPEELPRLAGLAQHVYEEYLLDFDTAPPTTPCQAPAPRPAPLSANSPEDVQYVGRDFWRYFPSEKRTRKGTVRCRRGSRSGTLKFLVHYPGTGDEARTETVTLQDLRILLANGDTAQSAAAATGGALLCEVCLRPNSSAAPTVPCVACALAWHVSCLPAGGEVDVGADWFCPMCAAAVEEDGDGEGEDPHPAVRGRYSDSSSPAASADASSSTPSSSSSPRLAGFGFAQGPWYSDAEFEAMADRFQAAHFPAPPTEAAVEREFWRLVEAGELSTESLQVEYGSDIATSAVGSGFPLPRGRRSPQPAAPQQADPRNPAGVEQLAHCGWNLNVLPTLPGSALRHLPGRISGLMVPWLYMGMCLSCFCWHYEDHALYSINYLHRGRPKLWYGVPGSAAGLFEQTVAALYPDLVRRAPDLFCQLVTMVHPTRLRQRGVPVCTTTQQAGEFVVTFPMAYHSGINLGTNCAEAVNFAPADWVPAAFEAHRRYQRVRRTPVLSHEALALALVRAAIAQQCRLGEEGRAVLAWLRRAAHEYGPGLQDRAVQLGVANVRPMREFNSFLHGGVRRPPSTRRPPSAKVRPVVRRPLAAAEAEAETEAAPQCAVCRQFCPLAAVACEECLAVGRKRKSPTAVACLDHASELCCCGAEKRMLFSRCTAEEWESLLRQFESVLAAT